MARETPSFLISIRFLIAIIAFFGYAIQYNQRIIMSVAIVCMINNTALEQQKIQVNNQSFTVALKPIEQEADTKCMFDSTNVNLTKLDGPFEWDSVIRGYVLGAYFWGYITTQIAGGFLSTIFGAKIVIGLSILIASVLSLLIPVASTLDYKILFLCRFFTGVFHGVFWPAMSSLWAHWAPPNERSKLVGIANAGSQIGNVAALSLGGYLCVNGFAGGWPSIFYIFGAVGIVWVIFWMALTSKSPRHHRFISAKEKQYIIDTTTTTASALDSNRTFRDIAREVPWLSIAKSKPFWGIVFAQLASNFGTYLFLTQLPTYMKQILKFDIKSNGFLSSLPYVVFWFMIVASGIIADSIIKSKRMSKTNARKLFNTISLIVPMAAVITLTFVTCAQPYIGVALLTVGLAFTGCGYGAGFVVNFNDIAGKFAGITFGLANTIGTISGIVAPSFVGFLATNGLQSEWSLVFYITAVVYLVGAIAFIILASGETEEWANSNSNHEKETPESIPLNNARI